MVKAVLRQFSLAFKLKIIKYYERLQACSPSIPITERSLGFVAKKAKISRQCLRVWLKKRTEISEEVNKHLRFKTKPSNTKCMCDEMERRLTVWLQAEREKGACIDSVILRSKGEQFYNEIHQLNPPVDFVPTCPKDRNEFKFSQGWFCNFLKRNGLALRRISSTGRDLPRDTLLRIASFYKEVSIFLFGSLTL